MLIRDLGLTTVKTTASDRLSSLRQTTDKTADIKIHEVNMGISYGDDHEDIGIYTNNLMANRTKDFSLALKDTYFTQFFPVRPGYSNQALGETTRDPSVLTSSTGKSLTEAANDARAMMDKTYSAMRTSSSPFDWNAAEGRDRNALFGDLDRRSLLAIRENVSGLFSSEEQAAARDVMDQQQGLAMGLYAGPLSQKGSFHDPFLGDHTARFKAASEWLSRVSSDEMATAEWMLQRASIDGFLARNRNSIDRFDDVLSLAELLFPDKVTNESKIRLTWQDTVNPHSTSSVPTPLSIERGTGSA